MNEVEEFKKLWEEFERRDSPYSKALRQAIIDLMAVDEDGNLPDGAYIEITQK